MYWLWPFYGLWLGSSSYDLAGSKPGGTGEGRGGYYTYST